MINNPPSVHLRLAPAAADRGVAPCTPGPAGWLPLPSPSISWRNSFAPLRKVHKMILGPAQIINFGANWIASQNMATCTSLRNSLAPFRIVHKLILGSGQIINFGANLSLPGASLFLGGSRGKVQHPQKIDLNLYSFIKKVIHLRSCIVLWSNRFP